MHLIPKIKSKDWATFNMYDMHGPLYVLVSKGN